MSYNIPNTYTLLAQQTASNSATISFTSGITSNFLTYYIKIVNIVAVTNDVRFRMLFSTNGGSSYLSSGYSYGFRSFDSGAGNNWGHNASSAFLTFNVYLEEVNNGTTSLNFYLFNLTDSVTQKSFISYLSTYDGTDSVMQCAFAGGTNTGTTAVNAIQFLFDSGNISTGSFYLYGVTE